MSAPLRNRVLLKKLTRKGLILNKNETQSPVKWIPLRCQNIRQYSSLHRLNRLRRTVIRGERYEKLYAVTVIRHASSINPSDIPPGYIPDVPDVPEIESWNKVPDLAELNALGEPALQSIGLGGYWPPGLVQQSDIPPGYIPDVPDVPEIESWNKVPDLAELNALGEPTLQSIGLGSYWPPGLVQQGLEMIHTNLDIPWWTTIAIGVVIIRTCMFPLVIKQRKTLVGYHNILPQVQKIQAELTEAQAATDHIEAQKAADKMKKVMTDNNIFLRNIFLPILCQIPVFMSVFFGLRKMAEYPVLSMQTGGCLWFENLTVADPTVMLPVITAATLWINLELGSESMKTQSAAVQPIQRAFMRAMPLVTLVVTMQFPAALCVYWASSNIFTLAQAQFLRIPAVRSSLGIPVEKQHPASQDPPRKVRMVKRVKDAYRTTSKLTEAQNREQVKTMNFKRSSDELMEEGWRDDVVRPTESVQSTQNVVRPTKTVTNRTETDKAEEQESVEVRQKQKL